MNNVSKLHYSVLNADLRKTGSYVPQKIKMSTQPVDAHRIYTKLGIIS